MSLRFLLLILLSFVLNPLWGQQEMLQSLDSLETTDPALAQIDSLQSADSLQIVDSDQEGDSLSLAEVSADSVESTPLPLYATNALMSAWRRAYPFSEPYSDALMKAREDSLNPSALRQQVDTLVVDPSLSYAQRDLRMPLAMDGSVPDTKTSSVCQLAQNMASAGSPFGLDFSNPYEKQLAYSSLRSSAVYKHSLKNLRSVTRFRSDNSDLPTERKMIDRQELSSEEQLDAGLGLELETASLNVEQITFHADKWHRKGTTDVQVSQTALSENWYKGGDNNMTLSTYDKLVFSRYDESKKSTLDITLELRLSGYYTKADTVHSMRVNDNQFRADVSYGYKAWKNWYYSSTAYIKTPIFEYFNANSLKVKSNFFAPLELNVAVGMDLKLTKNKNLSYSLMLAPLSYNLKYVADERVNVTSFGIQANRRQLNQIGASITSKLEWKINESVAWSSRAYFFTSYHNTQLEFENTFNVTLGRYSTAKIYLYPRFDDGIDDKIQMKEMLTFGLAFAW